MITKVTKPQKKNSCLVFTSAGDASNVEEWLKDKKFDLWVCYYGDQQSPLKNKSDFYFERKGGKVQNFYYALQCWENVLNGYESILLADDDIIISGKDINKLFATRVEQNLKALQPSFDFIGKNSYQYTQVKPFSKLRYTNFLEIGFVLFEKKALFEFMELYDPIVNCWGVDWWFSYYLKEKYGHKSLAIIDEVTCINPHDDMKISGSEIGKFSSLTKLAKTWDEFSHKHQIKTDKGNFIVYGKIPSYNIRLFLNYLTKRVNAFSHRVINFIQKN